MGVALVLDAWLSLLNCLLVLLQDLFVLFEELTSSLGVEVRGIEPEVVEVWTCCDEIGVLIEGVENDVEERDSSTGIAGILPHEEDIIGDLWREVECFLLFELLLGWCFLIEEEDA